MGKKVYGIMAFCFPILVILIVLKLGGYYPFGDISLVYNDMEFQYVDFFMWLHRVLEGKEFIGYSFNAGLGGETVALVAYYLASPLNILLIFAPIEKMAQFLSILIILKISLCGVTAYFYLSRRFEISGIYGVLISTSYALMGYNILQCSNVMWLDGVIVLPILALGVYKLVVKEKRVLYYITLFYAIISNWYTGYMLCIASALIFAVEMSLYYSKNRVKIKVIIAKMVRYAIVSVLSVMTTLFLFLPQTMQMMKQGKEIEWAKVLEPNLKFAYLNGFRDLYLQNLKLTQNEYVPASYVGSIVLLLCIMFFISNEIGKAKKYIMGIFVAGIMLLMCFSPTNLMFTGFRFPYSHFYRQSFIFSFAMVMTAGMYIRDSSSTSRKKDIVKAAGIALAIGLVYDLLNHTKEIYISFLMIAIIAIGFWFYNNQNKKNIIKMVAGVVMLLCLINEFSVRMKWELQDHSQSASYYTNYNNAVESQIAKLEDKLVDYRLDKQMSRFSTWESMGNESMAFGYSSISQYSSTGDYEIVGVLEKCGYGSGDNFNLPYRSILPMDSLLGVKYIFSTTDVFGCDMVDSFSLDGGQEVYGIYKNPYALPITLMTNIEQEDVVLDDNNPFANHNRLYSLLCQNDVELYEYAQNINMQTDGQNATSWNYKVGADGPLYLYLKNASSDTTISVNGEVKQTNGWYNNRIVFVGNYTKDDEVSITATGGTYQQDYGIQVATLDMEKFSQISKELQLEGVSLSQKSNGVIKVECQGEDDGTLFLSIPYDDGWQAWKNDKSVQISKTLGDFMTIPLENGENIITLKYRVPGLRLGVIMSICSAIVFCICEIVSKKNNALKKKLYEVNIKND